MNAWELALVLGMATVTFAVRYPVLALVSRVQLHPVLLDAMRYIPPAVLAAIIVPSVLMPGGGAVEFNLQNEYLVAGVVAMLVSWRTRNLLLTIALGMATFWVWRIVVG